MQFEETMKPRTLRSSLALFLVTVVAGLAVRMAPLGLPWVVVKYGGSMLWAAIATAVEFFKLYHSPGMDAFRLTLPGMILLGRYFSVRDIAAYWVAISVSAWVDGGIRRMEG